MIPKFALVLATLVLPASVSADTVILQDTGYIGAGGGFTWNLTKLPKDKYLHIEAKASNQQADLDCYLIIGGTIVAKDEDPAADCSLGWTPRTDDFLRIWIRNNSKKDTTYRLRVTR